MLPVTTGCVTPVSPESNSNIVAKSALAVIFTCFEIAASFSITTSKFSGALKETTNCWVASASSPFKFTATIFTS